jgi:hypothetical protein
MNEVMKEAFEMDVYMKVLQNSIADTKAKPHSSLYRKGVHNAYEVLGELDNNLIKIYAVKPIDCSERDRNSD